MHNERIPVKFWRSEWAGNTAEGGQFLSHVTARQWEKPVALRTQAPLGALEGAVCPWGNEREGGRWDSPSAVVPGGKVEGFQTLEAEGETQGEEGDFERLGDHEGSFTGNTQGRPPRLACCVPLSSKSPRS